jgi:23S rRNA (guanine745-N1)-methyltransferase
VQARRRLFDRRLSDYLAEKIETVLTDAGARGPILDVGCGEGFHLARLTLGPRAEGIGVDISTPAVDLAARTHPELTWIVANADRRLPLADETIGTILAITARVNIEEFARLVPRGACVLVATPGEDDLAELRELVLGEARKLTSSPNIETDSVRHFEVVAREHARSVIDADRETIDDLLVSTYRGQRDSQRVSDAEIAHLRITQSRDLLLLRRI